MLVKLELVAAVLVCAVGITWFAADAHYSQALASLEGQLKGAAKVQEAAVEAQKQRDAAATKDIDDKANAQIGSMADTIAGLLRESARGRTIALCPAPAGSVRPYLDPVGPAIAAGPGRPAEPARPTQDAAIAPAILGKVLDTGIDALKAELLWREYARRTGQVLGD
jgi:hypothetical protein